LEKIAGSFKRKRMKKFFLFVLFFLLNPFVHPQKKKEILPIKVEADKIEYFTEKNLINAIGNVVITYKDVRLTCQKAQVNTKTKDVLAEGKVLVKTTSGKILKCKKILYNLDKKTGKIFKSRWEAAPFYGFSEISEQISQKHLVAKKAWISTCDLEKPHWKLCAKRVDIYPQDKIIAKNVVMKILDIPVFYFPVYIQPLKDRVFRFGIIPGRDKEWGLYLLTYYRYYLTEALKGKLRLDWRENWGIAEGIDADLDLKEKGAVNLKLYCTDEEKKLNGFFRYRVDLSSKMNLFKGMYLVTEFHKFKDKEFLKDYFYPEYEKRPFPESYFYISKNFKSASVGLEVKKRANHFFTVTEFLPKVWFKIYNYNFKNFYYDSELEFVNFNKKYASSDLDIDCLRAFFSQRISFPKQVKGFTFLLYTGSDIGFYSKTKDTENVTKSSFKSGVSLNTSLFKIYEFPKFFLRHIVEPKVSFDFINKPTFEKDRLFIFDSKDKIDYIKKFTFTLNNFVDMKRESLKKRLLKSEIEVDYFLDSYQEKGFKDLKEKLEFFIFRKIRFKNDLTYSLKEHHLLNTSSDFTFPLSQKIKLNVGHYFSRDISNSLTAQIDFSPNYKWQFRYYQRYDFKRGEFSYHQFKIRRDLHCWFCDVIITRDQNKNWGFYIAFRLKAFPNIGVDFETTYHGPGSSGEK